MADVIKKIPIVSALGPTRKRGFDKFKIPIKTMAEYVDNMCMECTKPTSTADSFCVGCQHAVDPIKNI